MGPDRVRATSLFSTSLLVSLLFDRFSWDPKAESFGVSFQGRRGAGSGAVVDGLIFVWPPSLPLELRGMFPSSQAGCWRRYGSGSRASAAGCASRRIRSRVEVGSTWSQVEAVGGGVRRKCSFLFSLLETLYTHGVAANDTGEMGILLTPGF